MEIYPKCKLEIANLKITMEIMELYIREELEMELFRATRLVTIRETGLTSTSPNQWKYLALLTTHLKIL